MKEQIKIREAGINNLSPIELAQFKDFRTLYMTHRGRVHREMRQIQYVKMKSQYARLVGIYNGLDVDNGGVEGSIWFGAPIKVDDTLKEPLEVVGYRYFELNYINSPNDKGIELGLTGQALENFTLTIVDSKIKGYYGDDGDVKFCGIEK